MKKGLFMILFIFLLSGCAQDEEFEVKTRLFKHECIIISIESNQMLVASNDEAFSDKVYYFFEEGKFDDLELEAGTHVYVYWNGNQNDSDPPQRGAIKIEVISQE